MTGRLPTLPVQFFLRPEGAAFPPVRVGFFLSSNRSRWSRSTIARERRCDSAPGRLRSLPASQRPRERGSRDPPTETQEPSPFGAAVPNRILYLPALLFTGAVITRELYATAPPFLLGRNHDAPRSTRPWLPPWPHAAGRFPLTEAGGPVNSLLRADLSSRTARMMVTHFTGPLRTEAPARLALLRR